MSVIVRNDESFDLKCYVKGAPEVIIDLCSKDSVPINIKEQLATLTEKGYRVIAAAYRTLAQNDSKDRIHVEKDLIFLGLIVLENRVKVKTPFVLKTLNDSGFFCVMSTGKLVFI